MPLRDFSRPVTREWTGISEWEWSLLDPILPKRPKRRRCGRPRVADKACFEALAWLVLTDGTWDRLPKTFPDARTVRRRLREWRKKGTLDRLWRRYLRVINQDRQLKIMRALGLTGTRRRAEWRFSLDKVFAAETRRVKSDWPLIGRRRKWRFEPAFPSTI